MKLIAASDDLLALLGTRTEDGRRLIFEWGEPIGNVEAIWSKDGSADRGPENGKASVHDGYDVYVPTFTATDDGTRFCGCPKPTE